MRCIYIILFVIGLSTRLSAQSVEKNDIRNAYNLGKLFYSQGDFLQAFKFLLIYKYCNADTLALPKYRGNLVSVNKAIDYCEYELSKKLTKSITLSGRGYLGKVDDSIRTIPEFPPDIPKKQ